MNPEETEQGSGAWMHLRAGNCTGSQIYDVCSRKKNGDYTAERAKYMQELLCERLTGMAVQHFVNDAMQWGNENENSAKAAYEARHGILVEDVGYFPHPTIEHSGASPDGLVGEDGLLEIKCPTTMTHINTILCGEIPEEYTYQMAWEIECSGRQWADFVSHDPRLPGDACYFCKRYIPAPEFLESIRVEVIKFLAELAELEAKVRAYKA